MKKKISLFHMFPITSLNLFSQHTVRHFYDHKGEERLSDSGYYFIEWDRHAKKTIHSVAMPETPVHFSEMCNDEILCGLPMISSRSLLHG
jgi:hypothetical protein